MVGSDGDTTKTVFGACKMYRSAGAGTNMLISEMDTRKANFCFYVWVLPFVFVFVSTSRIGRSF